MDRDHDDDDRSDEEDSADIDRKLVANALDKYEQQLEKLCQSVISVQKENRSRQRRLQRQMKNIQREHKSLKQEKVDTAWTAAHETDRNELFTTVFRYKAYQWWSNPVAVVKKAQNWAQETFCACEPIFNSS